MPLAGSVIHLKNIACNKNTFLTQGSFDFNFSIEEDYKLPGRSSVEVIII